MRVLVLLSALAMPILAWLSQSEYFGPDNATISARYPTLLVPAGYAFSIWSLIFLLDLAYAGCNQLRRSHGEPPDRTQLLVAAGFALTAAWMVVFSRQWFWLALMVIWSALLCLVLALFKAPPSKAGCAKLRHVALGLHAGWLSLAVFLNTAQVIVAFDLLPSSSTLAWSLGLWLCAGLLLLFVNGRLGGDAAYASAALWGLAGAFVKQWGSAAQSAQASAVVACLLAAALSGQTLWLRRQQPHADR